MTNDRALPMSARINRLFETFHTHSEPEQSVDDVANSVSGILDQPVSATDLASLRAGAHDKTPAAPQLLIALAEHFQVPPVYLLGTAAEVATIDRELQLLASARDARVRNLALRGAVDVVELTDQLSQLATNHPATPDQQKN